MQGTSAVSKYVNFSEFVSKKVVTNYWKDRSSLQWFIDDQSALKLVLPSGVKSNFQWSEDQYIDLLEYVLTCLQQLESLLKHRLVELCVLSYLTTFMRNSQHSIRTQNGGARFRLMLGLRDVLLYFQSRLCSRIIRVRKIR
jgi:hypothetical protein